jgi:hypothetical protein
MTESCAVLEKRISGYINAVLGPDNEDKKLMKKSFDNFWSINWDAFKRKNKGKDNKYIFAQLSGAWRELTREQKIELAYKNVDNT